MLHPVKAATSFECDGCDHHASFHSLENPAEDAIMARWEEQEAASKALSAASKALVSAQRQAIAGAGEGRKRRRIADKPAAADDKNVAMPGMFEIVDVTDELEGEVGGETEMEQLVTVPARKARSARKAAGQTPDSTAEALDDDGWAVKPSKLNSNRRGGRRGIAS